MTAITDIMARAIATKFIELNAADDAWDDMAEIDRNEVRTIADSALSALSEAGYVVVPKEPTKEMLAVAAIRCHGVPPGNGTPPICGMFLSDGGPEAYSRMISAFSATLPETKG